MKYLSTVFYCICFFQLTAQISYDVDNDHVSFTDNFTDSELSHWTPGELLFAVPDLTRQSTFSGGYLELLNTSTLQTTLLENGSLKFKEIGGGLSPEDKMSLTKNGIIFINDASWTALHGQIDGAGAGVIDINNSSGGNKINMRVIDNYGQLRLFGSDGSLNAGIGSFNGANRGYIFVSPSSFTAEAGMYIDESDQGILFADVKNFRMPHPEDSNREIWYASIEGPEVAAYDRGTAQLENGEAFVSFKDHFKLVANTADMTVTLTPMEWDTYGLAVIEKTDTGFKVKELKGGTGNFEFDWEVKCVRKGQDKYKVIREKDENLNPRPHR